MFLLHAKFSIVFTSLCMYVSMINVCMLPKSLILYIKRSEKRIDFIMIWFLINLYHKVRICTDFFHTGRVERE